MRKSTKKPLHLSTESIKSLAPAALAGVGGAYNFNGSVNWSCYVSALSACLSICGSCPSTQ